MAADDEAARRVRAAKLRGTIRELREGERPPPSSPREFVEQQMRERGRDQDEESGDEDAESGDA